MKPKPEENGVSDVAARPVSQVEQVSTPDKAAREHVSTTSGDIVAAQIAHLRCIFTEVFVEDKVDFEKLRATLGAAAGKGPTVFISVGAAGLTRNETRWVYAACERITASCQSGASLGSIPATRLSGRQRWRHFRIAAHRRWKEARCHRHGARD
jgi:hypothetical protein